MLKGHGCPTVLPAKPMVCTRLLEQRPCNQQPWTQDQPPGPQQVITDIVLDLDMLNPALGTCKVVSSTTAGDGCAVLPPTVLLLQV